MKKFQYQVVTHLYSSSPERTMNRLGSDGWELVSACTGQTPNNEATCTLFFKREEIEQAQEQPQSKVMSIEEIRSRLNGVISYQYLSDVIDNAVQSGYVVSTDDFSKKTISITWLKATLPNEEMDIVIRYIDLQRKLANDLIACLKT